MKKRTIAMFLSVALCLSVALTGCGADKPQQSDPADDGKKSLTIAVLNDVVSLDPAVKDSAPRCRWRLICTTLWWTIMRT